MSLATLALAPLVHAGDTAPAALPDPYAFLTAQAAAWNVGDLPAFCAAYANDAVFLSPSGVTRGRAEVLARYQKKYTSRAAMGTLSFEKLDVRQTPAMASVAMRWTLAFAGKEPVSGLTTVVLVVRAGTWCIAQDASM